MKKFYFFVALCATAMVSCTSKELAIDSPSEEQSNIKLIPITITADFGNVKSDMVDATWTWKSGDRLAVYDGTAKREFTLDESAAGSAVAKFTGEVAAGFSSLKAVFPFTAAGEVFGTPAVPAEQAIAPDGTIDPDAMIAVADNAEQVSDSEYNFYFTSGISLLRFTPPAGATKVILLTAADGETIAGESTSVSIDLGSFADGTKRFWAAVNPAVFHGLKVFTRTENGDKMLSTTASIDLSTPGKGKNLGSLSGGSKVGTIENADDYIAFANAFKAGNYDITSDVYVLADLDFSGKAFTTVDNGTYKYGGTWYGNGHSMKNITATNVPMFYTPAGAILNDIIIDESCTFKKDVNAAGHWGIIARTLEPGGEMNNCIVNCDWNFEYIATSAVGYGGLVGRTSAMLTNCIMNGDIIYNRTRTEKETEAAYIGGLVGYLNADDSASGRMEGCKMNGKVIFNCPSEENCPTAQTNNKFFQIGGVVGYSKGTVKECHMYGDIEYYDHTWNTFLGGVVGNQEGSSYVDGCTMNGNLTAEQQYATASYQRLFVGGVVGRAAADAKVKNCTNIAGKTLTVGSKTNNLAVGGIIGSILGSATVSSCVNNMTIVQSKYGSKMMYIGGVNGVISTGTISDVQNHGAITVDQFSSESGGTVRVGGVIGSCAVDLDGGTIASNISSIHNTAQVYTHADETSLGYSHANFGGVVGVMTGNATNLTNSGKVYINFGDNKDDNNMLKFVAAGGIIGRLSAAKTVSGCINTAEVQFRYWGTAANDARVEYVGGIVGCAMTGQHSGGIASTIKNCTFSGRINESINNASYISTDYLKGKCVGGIVGVIIGTADSRAIVSDCLCNSATQHASSAGYFGGMVGAGDYINITNCSTTVSIKAKRIGGIAAMPRNTTISNCVIQNCTLNNFDQCGGIVNASNNDYLIIQDNFVKNVTFESQGTINVANFGAVARNPNQATTIQHNGISGSYKNGGTTTVFSDTYAPYTGLDTFTCAEGFENYIITE